MRVKAIVNPYANRWGAQAQVPVLRAAFARVDVTCDVALTTVEKQGTRVAAEAAREGYDAVVAAGGDGTVSEVVNGLIQASGDGPTVPLGILPLGTGNDFSDMVGVPRDLAAAAEVIAAGHTRRIDAGRVNNHFFDNNCALAMEPVVTIENVKMRRLSGNIRYAVAVIKALFSLRAWHMQLEWDGGSYEGPLILLSVCNGPRTGGLFYMKPDAKIDDGLLDVVVAPDMPRWRVVSLVPRLLNGTHIDREPIQYWHCRRLTVTSEPGTPIHADGEVISESERRIEYEIIPGKITLLTPAP